MDIGIKIDVFVTNGTIRADWFPGENRGVNSQTGIGIVGNVIELGNNSTWKGDKFGLGWF